MQGPIVTIIICTRDCAVCLRETLEAIGRLCVPEEASAEWWWWTTGQRMGVRELLERATLANMPLRSVAEARRGKGYAYNRGLMEARGEVILFTDDDVCPGQNWIEGMCRPIIQGWRRMSLPAGFTWRSTSSGLG